MGDPVTGAVGSAVLLDSNSWYFIAAEIPSGCVLGYDGSSTTSLYPRIYGRWANSGGHRLDYSGMLWNGDYNSGSNPLTAMQSSMESPCDSPGTFYAYSVDSFNYHAQIGN